MSAGWLVGWLAGVTGKMSLTSGWFCGRNCGAGIRLVLRERTSDVSVDLDSQERQVSIARRMMRLASDDAGFMVARGLLERAKNGERVFRVFVVGDEIKWEVL